MCRNKKIPAILAAVLMMISASGCGVLDALITDTGSGRQQAIEKENYLKQDVSQGEISVESLYQVLTLEKSTFTDSAFSQIMNREFTNVKTVVLDVKGVEAYFGEYLVAYGDYVKEGEPVAVVYLQIDEVAEEELKIRVQRLQSRYQQDQADYNKDIQELIKERDKTKDAYEKQLIELDIHKRQLDWQYAGSSYEDEIAEINKEMERRAQTGQRYEILAPNSGQVMIGNGWTYQGIKEGMQIDTSTVLCSIMDMETVYLQFHTVLNGFNYGKLVTVKTQDGELVNGTVTNADNWMLYGNLNSSNFPVIRLDVSKEAALSGNWSNLALNTNIQEINNVILIPEKAVTKEEDNCYVTVLKKDGTLQKTKFIPGGQNITDYWVLDGLEEGMQIVY